MRLSVQGCLILLLCFLSSFVGAYPVDDWPGDEPDFYSNSRTYHSTSVQACDDHNAYVAGNVAHLGYTAETVRLRFDGNNLKCEVRSVNQYGGGVAWYHEVIAVHYCSTNDIAEFCAAPDIQEPAECYENGQLYDNQTQQCVETCEHGELNGACLPPPEDNTECTKESSDYRGEVVIAYGKPPIPACGDFDQCSGDQPGQVGFFNGELRCLPEDFGVPECKGDSITVVDEYGFVCEPLTNKPEEPETPEEPNTDTDGDGQPDEYNPDNDPNIQRKQLDRMNDNQEQANDSLANLENIGKGTNSRLDDINSGVSELVQMGRDGQLSGGGGAGGSDGLQNDQGEDYLADLADIKQNTKDTADALQGPEGGFDTSGWLNAPTFEQSINGFGNAVSQSQIGQLVSGVSNIPFSSTCPVYVIPGTDYWEPMNMDVHCDILENHRATLSVLFMFFWTVSALFLFFRA